MKKNIKGTRDNKKEKQRGIKNVEENTQEKRRLDKGDKNREALRIMKQGIEYERNIENNEDERRTKKTRDE